jgi:hypothetical protein
MCCSWSSKVHRQDQRKHQQRLQQHGVLVAQEPQQMIAPRERRGARGRMSKLAADVIIAWVRIRTAVLPAGSSQ